MKNDLISRHAAIDALGEKQLAWIAGEYEAGLQNKWESDVEALKELPSVQPERKRGQWLDGYKRQTCSLCKGKGVRSWNYCPYCGADMREVDDERPD